MQNEFEKLVDYLNWLAANRFYSLETDTNIEQLIDSASQEEIDSLDIVEMGVIFELLIEDYADYDSIAADNLTEFYNNLIPENLR